MLLNYFKLDVNNVEPVAPVNVVGILTLRPLPLTEGRRRSRRHDLCNHRITQNGGGEQRDIKGEMIGECKKKTIQLIS